MEYKKIKLIMSTIILIFSIFIVIGNQTIKAQEAGSTVPASMTMLQNFAENDIGLSEQKNPLDIALSIINIVLSFLGLIFLVMIIYSGFQWMTSGGNEEIVTKAKKRLSSAVMGLGVILLSYVIANTIMLIIQNESLGNEDNWWQ